MKLNFNVVNKTLIVSFYGELDHHTAGEIRSDIDRTYSERNSKDIILDLDSLNFMDSSGIGLVMGRYKLTSQNEGKVYLINVKPRVEKILKMSGILKIVKVYSDLEEALSK